ncbi:hypothetical protein B0T20DRAFT_392626 [Sordaria brevicollis]|uniref:Uncharacterized protein n=1 Tax=Sordaria brevicollis TaxID=83679 RepID=A0AAE0UBP0_SORBR|nr:hypothetical protein B0T20DRAFT_392626 [Sordaria brevicollis]
MTNAQTSLPPCREVDPKNRANKQTSLILAYLELGKSASERSRWPMKSPKATSPILFSDKWSCPEKFKTSSCGKEWPDFEPVRCDGAAGGKKFHIGNIPPSTTNNANANTNTPYNIAHSSRTGYQGPGLDGRLLVRLADYYDQAWEEEKRLGQGTDGTAWAACLLRPTSALLCIHCLMAYGGLLMRSASLHWGTTSGSRLQIAMRANASLLLFDGVFYDPRHSFSIKLRPFASFHGVSPLEKIFSHCVKRLYYHITYFLAIAWRTLDVFGQELKETLRVPFMLRS